MSPSDLIDRYYRPGSLAHQVLMRHSTDVAGLSVRIAEKMKQNDAGIKLDENFVEEAAMLHDIGILYTDSPSIGCFGSHAYICHGYLGRDLLEKHDMPAHGRVCETHVGVGLGRSEIIARRLPIPRRDMRPQSVEEQIICFADTFFSKTPPPEGRRHSVAAVVRTLEKYGRQQVAVFEKWLATFGNPEEIQFFPTASYY